MQHFQPILIAIGILAIAGVLVHGFLLNRKNKLIALAEQEEQTKEIEPESADFAIVQDFTEKTEQTVHQNMDQIKDEISESIASVETRQVVDELPVKVSKEVVLENVKIAQLDNNEVDQKIIAEADVVKTESPTDIFIFNVVTREGARLGGHTLLQFFLTSGFRYGAMNIFHRHENSDGTGEVLFSIANMMAPGTFDLDTMERFNSEGISFFLTAPNSRISVKKSFEMMLRAVEQIAEEFECDVLNEQRESLTEKQFIEYRNRLQQYP